MSIKLDSAVSVRKAHSTIIPTVLALAVMLTGLTGCGGSVGGSSSQSTLSSTTPAGDGAPESTSAPSTSGSPIGSPTSEGFPLSVDLKDEDGYSFTVSGVVPSAPMVFTVETATQKPGNAMLSFPKFEIPLTVTNTTPGHELNMHYPVDLTLVAVYKSDSLPCEHTDFSGLFGSDGQRSQTYCEFKHQVNSTQYWMRILSGLYSHAGIGETRTITLKYGYEYPDGFVVPEDIAQALGDALANPVGWVMSASGGNNVTSASGSEFAEAKYYLEPIIWASPGITL